ncbi:VPDSG-CTERM sorting domain-containing protein [Opitutaceae bacterium]|nr:VPDSG-CTERM sorting domain-containing protein [Opitutaceae bacterium]
MVRVNLNDGSQSVLSSEGSIADVVVDGDSVWAIQQNPSFNILELDRTTGASTILPLDFSNTPGLSSLDDAHKLELSADGDLLVAGVFNSPSTASALRVDLLTGEVNYLYDGSSLVNDFIWDVKMGLGGDVLLAGSFNDSIGVLRLDTSGALEVVSSGGILSGLDAFHVVRSSSSVPDTGSTALLLGAGLLGLAAIRRRMGRS